MGELGKDWLICPPPPTPPPSVTLAARLLSSTPTTKQVSGSTTAWCGHEATALDPCWGFAAAPTANVSSVLLELALTTPPLYPHPPPLSSAAPTSLQCTSSPRIRTMTSGRRVCICVCLGLCVCMCRCARSIHCPVFPGRTANGQSSGALVQCGSLLPAPPPPTFMQYGTCRRFGSLPSPPPLTRDRCLLGASPSPPPS